MQQIINFIIRYKNFLLYILLLIISLAFTVQSHSFHQSRFFNSANAVTGKIYGISHGITTYFDLDVENERLLRENEVLRNRLLKSTSDSLRSVNTDPMGYAVVSGKVIKNSYAYKRNYITINRGKRDSVDQDMGVITDLGILGIVENTSNKFATVQSILNTKSNINAKLKNTNHFGSLIWDAKNYNVVQLIDIPRLVQLNVGDTIVTGAMSSIFPENVPIGTIKEFNLDNSKSFYRIDVALFNDMTNIKNVYIIKNPDREELLDLEKAITNE